MGETVSPSTADRPVAQSSAPVVGQTAVEPPVPLSVFATSLRPRVVPLVRNGRTVVGRSGRPAVQVLPGHEDEVWLRLLRINHASEKHTLAEWSALIDQYREQPAHPADPRMTQ